MPRNFFPYVSKDDPAISVRQEFMSTNLPEIYEKDGETSLDFAYTPRKPCQSKARYIALIKGKSFELCVPKVSVLKFQD